MFRRSTILFAAGTAAFGGFLFGYDTAVISGAVGYLGRLFSLGPGELGWAGASAIIGCIPGSMGAGFVSDRYGRKAVLMLSAVLYAVSGVWSALPSSFGEFLVARFIGGVGIGVSSMVCPTYIAEISPEKHRGRLGTMFQISIVLGILVVFFVNLMIQRMGDEAWNEAIGWRWMLGSEAAPALVFCLLLLAVPESPRWLLLSGKQEKARAILRRLVGDEAAEREITSVRAVSGSEEGRFTELFERTWRRPLLIAVGLAIGAQFSGINAIMYYAPEVFKSAGATTDAAFLAAVWVGVVNLVFTFVATLFVDRAGRRRLLLVGALGQVFSLAYVGRGFLAGDGGIGVLVGVLGYVAFFAIGMGPIPWIVISEIFPGRIRGRAASAGVLAIWVGCLIVAQTFPGLVEWIGPARTFWVYTLCSLASAGFVFMLVPETKGKTLEEIELSWRK